PPTPQRPPMSGSQPDPRETDPVIFDIFGQHTFGDLGSLNRDDPESPQVPGEILKRLPTVQDPTTRLCWEELINDPTAHTWKALVEGKHASQQSTGQAVVRSSAPTSTNVSAALGPSKRPTARSLQATSASVTTRAPTQEVLDDFFDRSAARVAAAGRQSARRRSVPSHLSDYEYETDDPTAPPSKGPGKDMASSSKAPRASTSSKKGAASSSKAPSASTSSKKGAASTSASKSKKGAAKKPKKPTPMSALERREKTAAMRRRAPESDESESEAEVEVVEIDDESDIDEFQVEEDQHSSMSSSGASEEESDEEGPSSSPTSRRRKQGKKGQAAKSKKKSKAKSKVAATTKEKGRGRPCSAV
ncbi:hypothetical protein CF335_g9008, partial [Tilletia laevis]